MSALSAVTSYPPAPHAHIHTPTPHLHISPAGLTIGRIFRPEMGPLEHLSVWRVKTARGLAAWPGEGAEAHGGGSACVFPSSSAPSAPAPLLRDTAALSEGGEDARPFGRREEIPLGMLIRRVAKTLGWTELGSHMKRTSLSTALQSWPAGMSPLSLSLSLSLSLCHFLCHSLSLFCDCCMMTLF